MIDKTKKLKVLGFLAVVIGFSMLLLNAISYIFNWEIKHPAFTIIGLVYVFIGLRTVRRTDKQAG